MSNTPQMVPPAPQQYQPQAPKGTDGVAVAGLITGLLFWPAGLILNPIALSRTKKNGTAGRGLAIAGLILSILGLIGTIIAIVATIAIAGATVSAIDKSVGQAGTVSASGAIGDTLVSEQKIAYTVTALTCGIPSVGDGALATEAQGQFCEVDLAVANQSSDNATFDASMVKGYIGTSEYSADSSAGLSSDAGMFLEQINPGNSVTGKVYIDIPAGAALDSVRINDGLFGADVEFAAK